MLVAVAGSYFLALFNTPAVTIARSPSVKIPFSFNSSMLWRTRSSVESSRLAWNGLTPQYSCIFRTADRLGDIPTSIVLGCHLESILAV